jgi:tetratricopeptide (TPR) repeat protein
MMVSTSKPVLLRHRQGPFTDRTILAIAAVLLVAVIANLVTRPERIGDESTAALQLQLPRLQRESERYPTHFATQYRYGNALTRQRDCASAVAPLERAVALNSDDGWAQNDLAYALTCARRYAAAIAPGREAIRLLPTERRPYYNLAWALEQSHDEQGAGEVYRQLLLHWPNEAVAMARAAFIHYRGGARKEGLAELQRALAIDDSSYWMLITAAELYSSAARLDDALNQYRALATRDSTNLWAWGQYGSTAYLAGRLDEARRAFDHLEKIAPHIFDSESPWRAMRDAARQNIPPSKLPPIPPFQRSDAMLIQLPSTR